MIALALILATVTGNPPPTVYTCNGVATVFTIPFPYLAPSNVVATVTTSGATTTLALATDFSVKPSIAPSTGTLTLTAGSRCANGSTLTISRVVPLTQPQAFRTGAYQGAAHEQALDRIEMQAQQLNSSIQAEITARAALATKEAADVAAAINPSPAAVNSNSLILSTGSTTSRTLAARAAELVNVKDYGAVGDGITNDTTAFNAAIVAGANKTVFVPPGTYIVKNVTVAVPVRIEGAGRLVSTLKMPVEASLEGSPILNVTAGNVGLWHIGFDGQKSLQPADGFSDSFNAGLNGTGRAYRALVKADNAGTEIAGLVIDDCLFKNAYGAGLAAQNVSHAKIRRNYGSGNNFEMFWIASTTATYYPGIEIVDNEILSTGSGHATVNGNAVLLHRATLAVIAHNHADTIERNFIKCESCTSTIIRGNTINNVTVANFGGIQLDVDGSDVVIAENAIKNCGAGVTVNMSGTGTGYFNLVISNNTINTTLGPGTGDGIAVNAVTAASSGISIVGNTMSGILRYGVRTIGGPLTDVLISNNKIKTQGAATQGGIILTIGEVGHSGYLINGNIVNLGDIQSSSSGVYVTNTGGNTVANLSIVGNTVLTGAHVGYQDSGNIITSGSFSGNYSDGGATFTSTNVFVADNNLMRSSSAWIASSQGRTATATPVTATIYDQRIITNLSVAGPVAVNLPTLASVIPPGHTLLIKDGKGDAAVNNITITRGTGTTIDGGTATKVINTNGGAVHFVFDGTSNWVTY